MWCDLSLQPYEIIFLSFNVLFILELDWAQQLFVSHYLTGFSPGAERVLRQPPAPQSLPTPFRKLNSE